MSIDNKNNNKKKRGNENESKVDTDELKMFSDNYIFLLQKPSVKFPKAKYLCKICPFHIADKEKAIKHCNELMHKKNYRRTCTRNMMQYLNEPTENQYDAINECLINTLKLDIFISEAESNRRKIICNEMNAIACDIGSRLVICGSLMTGLSIVNTSDVNLYLDLTTNNVSYLSQLNKLSTAFTEKLELKTEVKLDKRNCGLFCKDSQNVVYHITSNSRIYQLTSNLISIYMQIDRRAEQLIQLLRYFANKFFIDLPLDGLFPAQVFPLLVIFYLQQLSTPILPNLHKLAENNVDLTGDSVTTVLVNDTQVRYLSDLVTLKRLWTPPSNSYSLAHLWVGMLRFYAIDFDINLYMVSVRCTEPLLKIDRNIVNKRLAVDDPFDVKRNLLFNYNSPDAVDFFNDQLQGCYVYFAIPQLTTGPAFSKVNFMEMTMESMSTMVLITPTFTKDDFTISIELMESEFKRLYATENAIYDISKWPVRLFVKYCLSSILTSIFDSRQEIASFVSLLDLKGSSYFGIGNYAQFREHAMNLTMCVLGNFSDYLEATGSWTKSDINSKEAFEVIKKATHKFINESLNITMNDDDNENDEFEMHDSDCNEVEMEELMEDLNITVDDYNDDIDGSKQNNEKNDLTKSVKCTDLESWKIPISFKLISLPQKGVLESGNENNVYNEHRVQSITKDQMNYCFTKIPIHKIKLEIVCSLCGCKGHRKEFCSDAIPRFKDLQYILRDVSPDWLRQLNSVLYNKLGNTMPTEEMIQKHEVIFNKINQIIKNLYPNVQPQTFGSSRNGFMTRASDIDICLEFMVDDKKLNLSNKEITTRLKSIGRDLKKNCPGIDVSYVLRAKVPIIKFYSKNGIQGDISINNSLAIQNTKMLKLYAELYDKMVVLGNLLKFISKSCEIGDASQGTLSSYAYIIMLIHFLQKRGLLPVLQELYEGERPNHVVDNWDAWFQSNREMILKLWTPKQDVPKIEYLWLDFFYYYAVEFDIDQEVVSIKQSKPLFKIDKNWQMSYMAIEDPFDLNHNLSGFLSLDKCRYILNCFAHVLKLHGSNDNLLVNRQHLLMEPSVLRPAIPNTTRICFKCNKQGHVARDCTESQFNRPYASRNGMSNQSELPTLSPQFHFKESVISNRFFVKTDLSGNVPNASIPLKSLNGGINDFSVVQFSLPYGDKSIVIPMLVCKDNRIYDKFDNIFKNEHQNMSFSLPIEAVTGNVRGPDALQRIIPTNFMPNSSVIGNNTMSNNSIKHSNKKLSTPVQNNRATNDDLNQKFMNMLSSTPNQTFNRQLPSNPSNYNMANNSRAQGFNNSTAQHFGQGIPHQLVNSQKYFPPPQQQQHPQQFNPQQYQQYPQHQQYPQQSYPQHQQYPPQQPQQYAQHQQYPQMQQNSRQMTPNNANSNRYQNNRKQ